MENLHRLPEEIDLPPAALMRAMIAMEIIEERRKLKRGAAGYGDLH